MAGGALRFESHSPSSSLQVDSCRFIKNRAKSGGAAEIDGGSAFLDTIFVGNKAWRGGAIHGHGFALVFSTIARNRAVSIGGQPGAGGGVFVDGNAGIALSIVWGNAARLGADAFLDLLGGSAVGISRTDLGDVATAPGGDSYADGGGNLDVDPLLYRDAARAGHLRPGSPVVDTADCGGPPVPDDIDADPRPIGAACDMGADELAP